MSELRAEPLSPIDAATLWPQMHRLSTEVVATRAGENLLLASGLAATGLAHLPRMPRTVVIGVKRGLTYRGVVLARELPGHSGWEAVSLRIHRETDDEAVTALLAACGLELARREARLLIMRYPEGSPHETAIRRGGLASYRQEQLHALPRRGPEPIETPFRPARRADRAGVFRLYCRAVPAHIRRAEAATQQEFRAVLGSFDCEREFVLDSERGALAAWAGIGERECRIIIESGREGLADGALGLIEHQAPRQAALVLGEEQSDLAAAAEARGYTAMGVRHVCARRLAILNSLKEVAAVPAELAWPR